jgi:diguanylate cyclase (GGDEF)-like protein/PAS domain S-box-containing protein
MKRATIDDQWLGLELAELLAQDGASFATLERAAVWIWEKLPGVLDHLRLYVLDVQAAVLREEVVIEGGEASQGGDVLALEQLPRRNFSIVRDQTHTELQIVLRSHGEPIGLLAMRAPAALSREVMARLRHIARGLSLGVASVHRARDAQRSADLLRATTLVSQALHDERGDVAERLSCAMVAHFKLDRVTLCLFADGPGVPARALCARTGGFVRKLDQSPPIPPVLDGPLHVDIPPGLWVPLRTGERYLGVLLADNLYSLQPVSTDLASLIADLSGVIAMALDKTRIETLRAAERRQAEAMLRESEMRYRAVAELSSDFAFSYDVALDGTTRSDWVTDALTHITGYLPHKLDDAEGWMRLIVGEDRERANEWWRKLCAGIAGTCEVRILTRAGESRHLLARARPSETRLGAPVRRIYGAVQDITDKRRWEQALEHQASHDPLTGLPNRALFDERLRAALGASVRDGSAVALLLIDLDRFKAVNDELGHHAGDALLRQVAQRLLDCGRVADVVARLGGDEFAVLLSSTEAATATVVAHAMHTELMHPFRIEGRLVEVGASIGIAIGPGPDCDAEALLRHADVAMYTAKAQGGSCAAYVPGQMRPGEQSPERTAELRAALEHEQFRVYYQPLVDLATNRITGAEALVRWEHPEHGLVAPVHFISLAEQTGLIVPLGRWILEQACRTASGWQARYPGTPQLGVSVNLSPRQLADAGLLGDVQAILASSGLQPNDLTLEITEGVLLHDSENTRQQLQGLKRLGVRLAIDDFGTGYSSLAYLQQFSIDTLKVDKTFVDRIEEGADQLALVRTILALATSLRLETVAEGIEQASQAALLTQLGCRRGQGYLFGRPMPEDEFEQLLKDADPDTSGKLLRPARPATPRPRRLAA